MSHKDRMKIIEQEGSGGFALEEDTKSDSTVGKKNDDTVDVAEIVAKYDKEATIQNFFTAGCKHLFVFFVFCFQPFISIQPPWVFIPLKFNALSISPLYWF